MKALLIIFAVCACTYSAQVYRHGDHKPRHLEEIIQRKCESNSGDTQAFERFQEEADRLRNCIPSHLSTLNLFDPSVQHEDICRVLRESDVYGCVSNFTDVLLPCLDETEAYFPDYLLTIVNSTYVELCGENGRSNYEYLLNIFDSQNPKIQTCLKITGTLLLSESTYSNLNIYKNLRDNSILNLNANDLCSDLKSIHKTFSALMKQECNDDYSRFVDLQSQPFVEVCNIV